VSKVKRLLFLFLYYVLAKRLPRSSFPILGAFSKWLRYLCCKNIFKRCGKGVNIERNAYFGTGFDLEIGNFSGIGINCVVPFNIKIGDYVMMAPDVLIHKHNHAFADLSVPMALQGLKESAPVIIGDDVWIGQRAIVNPGRRIGKGMIVASGAVLVKDFPDYSVVGGNPSRLMGSRISGETNA